MDEYKIKKEGKGKYTILTISGQPAKVLLDDEEQVAQNLDVLGLAKIAVELYQSTSRPVHQNPDKLPEQRGIRFTSDDDLSELHPLATLFEYVNTLLQENDSLSDIVRRQRRRIEEARRLLK